MSVTVQKGTKMYCPNPEQFPESRYVVFLDIDERWRWLWEERDEPDEIGPSFATRAEALASIADDWEASGGTDRPRFVGMLRGLAKREAARSESEYTPTLDELLSAYINKRAMTFTAFEIERLRAQFDRAIERVRAEQREKDAQIAEDLAISLHGEGYGLDDREWGRAVARGDGAYRVAAAIRAGGTHERTEDK